MEGQHSHPLMTKKENPHLFCRSSLGVYDFIEPLRYFVAISNTFHQQTDDNRLSGLMEALRGKKAPAKDGCLWAITQVTTLHIYMPSELKKKKN